MEESLGSNQSQQEGLFSPFRVRQAGMKGPAGRNHCLQIPLCSCGSCADHAYRDSAGVSWDSSPHWLWQKTCFSFHLAHYLIHWCHWKKFPLIAALPAADASVVCAACLALQLLASPRHSASLCSAASQTIAQYLFQPHSLMFSPVSSSCSCISIATKEQSSLD